VHPSEVFREIVLSSETVASLSVTPILRTIEEVPFTVDVLDMTSEGPEETTTVFASSPHARFCRRHIPMD
jgi:hypothetical protein